MNYKQFLKALAIVGAGVALSAEDAEEFETMIERMTSLLDEADYEDFYGTQGWTYCVFGE